MRRWLPLAFVLMSAPALAQPVVPSTVFPPGVTPPVFGQPASAVNGGGGVNASLIPTADNTFDLGSASFQWRTLYLGTSLVMNDVSLSRGATNRLDLATGDSFHLVSGGLGVGTVNAIAGRIAAAEHFQAANGFGLLSGSRGGLLVGVGADGRANFINAADSAGVGLDFATDSTLKIRNRAQNADAALTALSLTATQAATDTVVQTLSSTATSDDPTEAVRQYRATTTSGVAGAAATFTIPTSTSTLIKCSVVARRTGGAAGSAEDSAMYDIAVGVKNTAGAVAEIAAETLTVYGESQAGWTVTAAASGATEVISVTGATDNNVTWHLTCRTYGVNQ